MDHYIIGQILGILLAIESLFIYTQRSRKGMLKFKLLNDFFTAIQNLLIGAYTGAMLSGICCIRELVFFKQDKHGKNSGLILAIFLLLTLISPILTWSGWVSLLPTAGSLLAVIAFYMIDPQTIRILGLAAHSLWLLYCIFQLNIGGLATNVVLVTSAVIGLIRYRKEPR